MCLLSSKTEEFIFLRGKIDFSGTLFKKMIVDGSVPSQVLA